MRASIGFIAALGVLAAAVIFAMAGGAAAQTLSTSAHNLTTAGTGTANAAFKLLPATQNMCTPCHAPHKANAAGDLPLQNRASSATLGTYTYSPSSPNAGLTVNRGGSDLICLSCHDGTIAVDAWTGGGATMKMAATTAAGQTASAAFLGTTLSGTHPTNMTYTGGGSTGLLATPTTGIKLIGGKVQCASCHNAHDAANTSFLRLTPASLCQGCHVK